MWTYWLCNTRTGEKLLQVKSEDPQWATELNVAQSGSHVFDLADLKIQRETMWGLTTPTDRTLVQCWNDKPRYAGLITGRPYNRDASRLTIRSRDVRSIFLDRYPFGVNSYWSDPSETTPGRLVTTNLTARAIAARVVQQGLLGPLPNYPLPIVLPSATEVGGETREFENFNFRKVADILDELQKLDGGPDIEFAPRWSAAGTLEWVMRAGALTGNTFEFNLTAKNSKVKNFHIDEDASRQVTGVFGLGEGSGADRKVGGTPGADIADIPARDEHVTFPMAKTHAEASSYAREYLASHKKATWQPSFTVRADEVDPSELILGSTVRVYDKGDWWNPDGWQDLRLIGLSGNGEDIDLTVQGARG